MNNLSINNFGLTILVNGTSARKEYINRSHYFLLSHGENYKLKLSNDRETKCDAEIWIDGVKIGCWRINEFDNIIVERPAKLDRKFIFLKENSREANSAEIINGKKNNGLIKIIFKPEKKKIDFFDNSNFLYTNYSQQKLFDRVDLSQMSNSFSPPNLSHGATALGDQSNQLFNNTHPINNIDNANITIIMARLMVDNNQSLKPLFSLNKAIKSTNYPNRFFD